MITGAVVVDLKKAFDLVGHECFLFKLEHYRVRGGSQDWFRNYILPHELKECNLEMIYPQPAPSVRD